METHRDNLMLTEADLAGEGDDVPIYNESRCSIDFLAGRRAFHGETAQVVLMGETGSPSTRLDLRPGHQPKLLVSLAA